MTSPEPRTGGAPAQRDELFYCPARRRRLRLEKCLDDYVTANAMSMARRVCYRCPLGRANRHAYAEGLPLGSRA